MHTHACTHTDAHTHIRTHACTRIAQVFRMLPFRIEILRGLLGADLLGFHVYEYARHFLHACTHLLGSEVRPIVPPRWADMLHL